MHKELFDDIAKMKLSKTEIERACGMPRNSLSAYCAGHKELPKKFIGPVQEYVDLVKKYKAEGKKLPKGLSPLRYEKLKKAASIIHDRPVATPSVIPQWDPELIERMNKGAAKAVYNGERNLIEDDPLGLKEPEFSDKPLVMQGKKALNTFQDIANLPKKHAVKAEEPFHIDTDQIKEGKPEVAGAHIPEALLTAFEGTKSTVVNKKREYVHNLKTVEPLPGSNAFFLKYGKWS